MFSVGYIIIFKGGEEIWVSGQTPKECIRKARKLYPEKEIVGHSLSRTYK